MGVEVHHISKQFGTFPALNDVSLKVQRGELLAMLGPSGSGKTTLLRVIAGLEIPDEGRVVFADEDVTEKSAYERRAGFVFQQYALFQHMNVFENIAFGLRVLPKKNRPDSEAITKRVSGCGLAMSRRTCARIRSHTFSSRCCAGTIGKRWKYSATPRWRGRTG